jgi:hypothetical protein
MWDGEITLTFAPSTPVRASPSKTVSSASRAMSTPSKLTPAKTQFKSPQPPPQPTATRSETTPRMTSGPQQPRVANAPGLQTHVVVIDCLAHQAVDTAISLLLSSPAVSIAVKQNVRYREVCACTFEFIKYPWLFIVCQSRYRILLF